MNVLWVEDDLRIIKAGLDLLEEAGHVVVQARTFKCFQREFFLNDNQFDVIICDGNFPMWSGKSPEFFARAVYGEVRRKGAETESGREVPICFFTGDPKPKDYDFVIEDDEHWTLLGKVDMVDLVETVNQLQRFVDEET